jgi:hypothetical protein
VLPSCDPPKAPNPAGLAPNVDACAVPPNKEVEALFWPKIEVFCCWPNAEKFTTMLRFSYIF